MKGLIVREPWIHWLLDGSKDWEIRGRNTTIRGRIAVILAGSGLVLGTIELVDCLALTPEAYYGGESHHRIPQSPSQSLPYVQPYAWVMSRPHRWATPQPYQHPRGAVIWVKLPDDILAAKEAGKEKNR